MNHTFKQIIFYAFSLFFISCGGPTTEQKAIIDAQAQLEKDLELYSSIWNTFLNEGDTTVVNSKNFTEDVVVVTSEGDIVGIEGVRNYYYNFNKGFSNIEFTIVDAFGQGDKIMKYWNFKGVHTGEFFGIPPTGNKLDLSGTTLVTMINGKIAKEHDFFDMKSMLDQLLQVNSGDVTIDAQNQGVL